MMKWVFSLLLVLNILVFGTVVFDRVVLKKIEDRESIALAKEAHLKTDDKSDAEMKEDALATDADPKTGKPQSKDTSASKKADVPTKSVASVSNAQMAAEQAKDRLNQCGQGSVVLEEDTYHRIKSSLNQWPNAASRHVGKNPKSEKEALKKEYVVVVPMVMEHNEQLMTMIASGLQPREQNGLITLGQFSQKSQADKIKNLSIQSGFSANVMEKTLSSENTLTRVTYEVVFSRLTDNDARQISAIVKPYASLNRGKCKK